jgi:hypothetical protein
MDTESEGQTRYCVDLGKNSVHVKNRQWLIFHAYMLSLGLITK